MAGNYRLYCMNGDGYISQAEWIEAEDDDAALLRARELRPDAHKCEVWQKNRLVGQLNGEGEFERVSP